MKICPKCQTANSDTAIICKACSASVSAAALKSADELLRKEMETIAITERRRDAALRVAMGLMIGLHLLLFVLALTKDRGSFELFFLLLLTPATGFMQVLHPDFMFRLHHMFTIYNIDDVKPSDWYYFSSKLGGFLVMAMGIAVTAIAAFADFA